MKEGILLTNNVSMFCKNLEETWIGEYNFKEKKRVGNGVLIKNGTEYFVEYDKNEKEISRKRTFEGIRLMIGKFFFKNFFSLLSLIFFI